MSIGTALWPVCTSRIDILVQLQILGCTPFNVFTGLQCYLDAGASERNEKGGGAVNILCVYVCV